MLPVDFVNSAFPPTSPRLRRLAPKQSLAPVRDVSTPVRCHGQRIWIPMYFCMGTSQHPVVGGSPHQMSSIDSWMICWMMLDPDISVASIWRSWNESEAGECVENTSKAPNFSTMTPKWIYICIYNYIAFVPWILLWFVTGHLRFQSQVIEYELWL